jgi:hypothetical protein
MTSLMLSRVNVSSLNRVLILFKTCSWPGLVSSSTKCQLRSIICDFQLTVLESQVGGTQSVTEVLSKDPSDIGVGGFLNGMGSVFTLDDGELCVS